MAEERNIYTLGHDKDKVGDVKIAHEIFGVIAGLAATEVDGVSALAGNIKHEDVAKISTKNLARGVKVNVMDTSASVELAVVMDYGYSIPKVSAQIQERVKQALEGMTGLTVIDVNIRIEGVNIDKSKQ